MLPKVSYDFPVFPKFFNVLKKELLLFLKKGFKTSNNRIEFKKCRYSFETFLSDLEKLRWKLQKFLSVFYPISTAS